MADERKDVPTLIREQTIREKGNRGEEQAKAVKAKRAKPPVQNTAR